MRLRTLSPLLAAALLSGCNLNVVGANNQQILSALTPTYTGSLPNPWYLYQEGLMTGDWLGGLGLYIGGTAAYANFSLDFASKAQSLNSAFNMKLAYTAAIGAGSWAGGTFTHTKDFTDYAATPGRDLRAGLYTKCVFHAASPEGRRVAFNAQGVSLGYVQLTPAYQRFEIALPAPASQSAVKDFFGFAFDQPNSVGPVTVYVDDLRYER